MKTTIKGPAIFLAQFMGEQAPFDSIDNICKWAADLGYKGIQLPTWEKSLIDIDKASESRTYCEELKGKVLSYGLEITELCTHLQGQLVAVNPAYDKMFDAFAPEKLRNQPKKRQRWAVQQLLKAAKASQYLGLNSHATFSGSLMWHTVYPWPQRPKGLVKKGFQELGARWRPILDYYDECGVDVCYEIHPGEDLHDGVTYERFLSEVNDHPRACLLYDPSHFLLQQLDYLAFIDIYHERIRAFHVKDAEFNPTGRAGIYGSYEDWIDRPGRFRSLGDGQVDFKSIFSKLSQHGFNGWAVLEWECCIKSSDQGAREGVDFIKNHIIEVTGKSFDDFASTKLDLNLLDKILGL